MTDPGNFLPRSGSASLLVLGILVACVALLTGSQAALNQRSTRLRIQQNELRLRTAGVLGIRQGMSALAADTFSAFDDPREDWAQPMRFLSSEDVEILVQVSDAQNRFDVNRLSEPVSPNMFRTPEDMFLDLAILKMDEVDPEMFRSLGRLLREERPDLLDPYQLVVFDERFLKTLSVLGPHLSALPPASTGSVSLNLNTVQPEVLVAVMGPSFRGWIDSVLAAREAGPIPSVDAVSAGLPDPVKTVLSRVMDVRSDYFNITVISEVDSMQQQVRALVHRPSQGNVEVIRCQW